MVPAVLSAVKSGARSLMRIDMGLSCVVRCDIPIACGKKF